MLSGGLTMSGAQAEWTLDAARRYDPSLEDSLREMYNWSVSGKPDMSPPRNYNARLGLLVRELCSNHGLLDRMPRYITPGALAVNKRIAERLFLKTYDLELEMAKDYHIWAYRKAAWTVDELPESVDVIFRKRGEAGLRELQGIGKSIAGQIAVWLGEVDIGPG
jgi:hypothetical protein